MYWHSISAHSGLNSFAECIESIDCCFCGCCCRVIIDLHFVRQVAVPSKKVSDRGNNNEVCSFNFFIPVFFCSFLLAGASVLLVSVSALFTFVSIHSCSNLSQTGSGTSCFMSKTGKRFDVMCFCFCFVLAPESSSEGRMQQCSKQMSLKVYFYERSFLTCLAKLTSLTV